MWEYKHTDEMYTGRFDRSEKLFHSDVYLGQEFSNGIYHHKYIKKIPIGGGKYRYIYEITSKDNYNEANGVYEKIGGNKNTKYGTYTRTNSQGGTDTYTIKKSNKLFSSKTGSSFQGGWSRETVEEVGMLKRNYEWSKKKLKEKIKKGKKALDKLFKKTKAKSPVKVKYNKTTGDLKIKKKPEPPKSIPKQILSNKNNPAKPKSVADQLKSNRRTKTIKIKKKPEQPKSVYKQLKSNKINSNKPKDGSSKPSKVTKRRLR